MGRPNRLVRCAAVLSGKGASARAQPPSTPRPSWSRDLAYPPQVTTARGPDGNGPGAGSPSASGRFTMPRRLLAPALGLARRNGRPISWTPGWMGFGNHLYAWFWAWRGRARGEQRLVLRTPAMGPWLEEFPAGLALTVDPDDVR